MFRSTLFFLFLFSSAFISAQPRQLVRFNQNWRFFLGDDSAAKEITYNDRHWRPLNLPHDWSIEGTISETHPTTFNQGALPAGTGWYRKTFTRSPTAKDKRVFINFDGVYRNSEVWINGHYLGKRPNGYISFQYELTPYLRFGKRDNVLAVRVDNSAQPSSRWYTGSGIYRNVWLETTNPVAVAHWGSFVTTPQVSKKEALVEIQTAITNGTGREGKVDVVYEIYDDRNRLVASDRRSKAQMLSIGTSQLKARLKLPKPRLWSVGRPFLYKAVTRLIQGGKLIDQKETTFGIRSFSFDAAKGFFLNEKPLKILGVCLHHDLGALGAAVNRRAIERQLQILKNMGANAIRTAHNPPAPELLDLCDQMGFLVMDEAFDMWQKRKNKFDYSVDFAQWHRQDLADQVRRDRNHPSVFLWSIGNEIREQFDSTGKSIAAELAAIVKSVDATRPVTSALTENVPGKNYLYQSGALDLLGFNYKLADYDSLPGRFPGQALLAAETTSALATRGHYDLPSDRLRIWPPDAKATNFGNPDHTVSAYDHAFAYWGATHEQSWKAVKDRAFIAGLFVWSGFDFLGEPVPYRWPSRSAYYGIVDLAGFPKDVYYLYQSEWTSQPVLHLFPHWNWKKGDTVDVWAYYNNADEVELLLNGRSLGTRKKEADQLHVQWRVPFTPGTLETVSKKDGRVVLRRTVRTAGPPAQLQLLADRSQLKGDTDLSFVTVRILDAAGNLVPDASNLVRFNVRGPGVIKAVDNGSQTSTEPFQASQRKAFNGLCLAVIAASGKPGVIRLQANAEGLKGASLDVTVN